jgi:hypothetical protein
MGSKHIKNVPKTLDSLGLTWSNLDLPGFFGGLATP